MYTVPDRRGRGIAGRIVAELETWAEESNYSRTILETGLNQPAAIAVYKKLGYKSIANYCEYVADKTSACFERS
jgi:predicted GNAT family acetyltransferase